MLEARANDFTVLRRRPSTPHCIMGLLEIFFDSERHPIGDFFKGCGSKPPRLLLLNLVRNLLALLMAAMFKC